MSYEYLKKYIKEFPRLTGGKIDNRFYKVSKEDILKAELLMGYSFPDQLKSFYEEIGYGALVMSQTVSDEYKFYNSNRFQDPMSAALCATGQGWENGLMSETTQEFLEPGEIPFFEVCDSRYFLSMKIQSDNPNAVWGYFGEKKLEDSLERFIWRLYYEDPSYYDAILLS